MQMEIHLPAFFLQGSHWSHGPCPSQALALKHQRTRERKASITIQEIRKKRKTRDGNRIGGSNTPHKRPQGLHLARPLLGLKTKTDAAVLFWSTAAQRVKLCSSCLRNCATLPVN